MNEEEARELALAIVGEFEKLFERHGIKIPSDDREGREEETCIYGSDYYFRLAARRVRSSYLTSGTLRTVGDRTWSLSSGAS
jgi:hypothetical protein